MECESVLADTVEFNCFFVCLMSAVMNHAAASDSTEMPLSSSVMSNSRRPVSDESVQPADRSTIYRSHDYEELPASRFLS